MKATILVIEDDAQIRRFLRVTLTAEEYRLHEAVSASEGMNEAAARQPELILLDLGLPDGDGLDVIRKVREFSTAPIIVLSARGKESDKIAALDLGADDYVAKPFAVGELMARVRASLRRSSLLKAGQGAIIRFGNIEADLDRRVVTVDAREVHLTPNEYKLLQVFLKHPGKVMTQRQLLNEVWGPHHTEDARYLRVYMAQLRRKLEEDSARPRYFLTEPGVGYRLVVDGVE